VGGKYELVRKLGSGSMGEVWMAVHLTLGEKVAIKFLAREDEAARIEDPASAAARFLFEAQVAARLSRGTPYVVRVSDHGEEGILAYLVMELLEGQSLETWLLRRGPVEPRLLASLVWQVTRALEHAHAEGVVHRDLKPANIFIVHDESGMPRVKLLDFGIARAVGKASRDPAFATAANVVLGTPGYMSPEHVDGLAPPDPRCDLWALATVVYEALTGELPVPGLDTEELIENLRARRFVPARQRNEALPEGLDAFFERAFAARPEDRFGTPAELAMAFERAIRARPVSGAPTAFVRSPSKAPARQAAAKTGGRRAAIAGAAVALLFASALGLRALQTPEAPPVAAVPPPPPEVPVPAAATRPVAPVAPAPLAPSATESAAAPAPPAPSATCKVPYEYDANGVKRWKRACL
jgi:serine/threonine-protein kinase